MKLLKECAGKREAQLSDAQPEKVDYMTNYKRGGQWRRAQRKSIISTFASH
jgi:hypothetical protein